MIHSQESTDGQQDHGARTAAAGSRVFVGAAGSVLEGGVSEGVGGSMVFSTFVFFNIFLLN
jgi:hypothetical protein